MTNLILYLHILSSFILTSGSITALIIWFINIDKTFIKLRETEIPISQSSALGYTGQTWPNLRFFEFLDISRFSVKY